MEQFFPKHFFFVDNSASFTIDFKIPFFWCCWLKNNSEEVHFFQIDLNSFEHLWCVYVSFLFFLQTYIQRLYKRKYSKYITTIYMFIVRQLRNIFLICIPSNEKIILKYLILPPPLQKEKSNIKILKNFHSMWLNMKG